MRHVTGSLAMNALKIVANYLKGGKLELYLKEFNLKMRYHKVVDKLRVKYNTAQRKLSLQPEVYILLLDLFMDSHHVQYEKECLCGMI